MSTVCGFVTILGLMVGGIKYWGLSEAAVFFYRGLKVLVWGLAVLGVDFCFIKMLGE